LGAFVLKIEAQETLDPMTIEYKLLANIRVNGRDMGKMDSNTSSPVGNPSR
jgi:hypothetical protein